MHDLLFEHQDALQLSDLVGYAGDLGLDRARFEADLRSGRFGPRVAQDVNSAGESGVAGTPTYFIDDVRYLGSLDPTAVAAELDRLARSARVEAAVTAAEARGAAPNRDVGGP
jgi:predicted DsbA family dithiol-disulfide isomerase